MEAEQTEAFKKSKTENSAVAKEANIDEDIPA